MWGFLVLPLSFTPLFIITNTIPHWYLWFSNGKRAEINKDLIVNEEKRAEKKNNLEINLDKKLVNDQFEESAIPKKHDTTNNI